MPIVEIKWWKGRSKEQKSKLSRELFELFEKNGVKKGSLQIIFFDIEKSDWAQSTKPAGED